MKLIRKQFLSPSQAKELVHLGFILILKKFGVMVDEYEIYVIDGGK